MTQVIEIYRAPLFVLFPIVSLLISAAALVERRGIFEKTRVIRAEKPATTAAHSDAYLIWNQRLTGTKDNIRFYFMAPGETHKTTPCGNGRKAARPPFSELGVGDRRAPTLSDGLPDGTASRCAAFRVDRRPDHQQN